MQCSNCGYTSPDTANFCVNCGSPITSSVPLQLQEQAVSPSATEPETAPMPVLVSAKTSKPGGGIGRLLVIALIAIAVFFVGSRFMSCIGGGGAGSVSGDVVALNTDTKAAEDTVKKLLDAAKKDDSNAVSKLYLGDAEDFHAIAGSPTLITKQDIYDPAFVSAFGYFASVSTASKRAEHKINDKLHGYSYEIVNTMPLGNMLGKDLSGARVRVKVDSTYFVWAEEMAEGDMIEGLVEKIGEKSVEVFIKTLMGEYEKYNAVDWAKFLTGEAKDWMEDSVDFYYTALEKRLDEAPLVSNGVAEYVDFIVVKEGNDWKVSPMRASDLYYLWGGYTGKFGGDVPNKAVKDTRVSDYIPQASSDSAVRFSPAGYDGGKLSDVHDAAFVDGKDAKIRNAKYGRDSLGRWVVTGEAENTGADGSSITLTLAYDGQDAVGNDVAGEIVVGDVATQGGDTDERIAAAVMMNMKRGEKRAFAIYPKHSARSDVRTVTGIDKLAVTVVATSGEKISGLVDGVEVTVDSVYYDLQGATTISPSVVVTGRMKNATKETLAGPVPRFILTSKGVPLPALDKEQANTFGLAMTSMRDDGRTKAPASLGPGEEGEFQVHCELNDSNADGVFLHGVSVN